MSAMFKRILSVTLVFICIQSAIHCQEKQFSYLVMGVPQYMLNNGLRIELDIPRKEADKWLVLAPSFYQKRSSIDIGRFDNEYNKLMGGGLEVFAKQFLSHEKHGKGFYYAWGGGYRHFRIETSNFIWSSNTVDGLDWFERRSEEISVRIHNLSARGVAGIQFFLYDHMPADIYMGMGMQYATHKNQEGNYLKFNSRSSDFGYTGTLFVIGFRLGVGW